MESLLLTCMPTDGATFRITQLRSDGVSAIEHNTVTGDDRGGIATSTSRVFVTGDAVTGSFALSDLSGGSSLDVLYDGLVSNLRDGSVYLLATEEGPVVEGGGTITRLIQIDGESGELTSTRSASAPVPVV